MLSRLQWTDAIQVINTMTRILGDEGESVTVTLPAATDVNGEEDKGVKEVKGVKESAGLTRRFP